MSYTYQPTLTMGVSVGTAAHLRQSLGEKSMKVEPKDDGTLVTLDKGDSFYLKQGFGNTLLLQTALTKDELVIQPVFTNTISVSITNGKA